MTRKNGRKDRRTAYGKGKGWHDEPFRHGLARHGIKTARGKRIGHSEEDIDSLKKFKEKLLNEYIVTYHNWSRTIEIGYDCTTDLISMSIYTEIDDEEYPDSPEERNEIYQKYGENSWDFLEKNLDKSTFDKLVRTSRDVDAYADVFSKNGDQYHELTLEFDKDYLDIDELFLKED